MYQHIGGHLAVLRFVVAFALLVDHLYELVRALHGHLVPPGLEPVHAKLVPKLCL